MTAFDEVVVVAVRTRGMANKKNDTADIRTNGYQPRPITVSVATLRRDSIVPFLASALLTTILSIKLEV